MMAKKWGVTMKTQRSILIAFVLNLSFSLFELLGGWYTGRKPVHVWKHPCINSFRV